MWFLTCKYNAIFERAGSKGKIFKVRESSARLNNDLSFHT